MRATGRLSYPELILVSLHLMLQFLHLTWKEEALGNEVEVPATVSLLHVLYLLDEIVFSGELDALGELIYSLAFIKPGEERVLQRLCSPHHHPVVVETRTIALHGVLSVQGKHGILLSTYRMEAVILQGVFYEFDFIAGVEFVEVAQI